MSVHQASRKVGCECTADSCILHKYISELTAVKLEAKSVTEKLMDIFKNGFHHWKEHKEYY